MNDLHSALAGERTRSFLTEARYDGLARLGRSSARSAPGSATATGLARVRTAGHDVLHWLRNGQLAGYPSTCSTC